MNGHPTSVGQWARREAVGKARIFLKETVAVYFGTQDERVIDPRPCPTSWAPWGLPLLEAEGNSLIMMEVRWSEFSFLKEKSRMCYFLQLYMLV